jgi:hypothetical protein
MDLVRSAHLLVWTILLRFKYHLKAGQADQRITGLQNILRDLVTIIIPAQEGGYL